MFSKILKLDFAHFNFMQVIIPVSLLLINLWIFMPFFGLGLFGDDWLTIHRYSYYLDIPKHLGPYSSEYFNNFKYFFNAYGTQDTVMALLYKTFGVASNIYFITSYILRLIAGFSIFLPAYYITKKKYAAYFAVFFFLFSACGLETSGWVFNLTSYFTITFFSIFVYLYLKAHQEKLKMPLLLSYLFFFLSFISNLIRSHGLIPFIVFLEIFWLLSERSWRGVKPALIRILGFLLIFLAVYILGLKETVSGSMFSALKGGLITVSHFLSQGRFDFLFYPITTLGGLLIPESFISSSFEITLFSQYLFKIFLPIFFIYMMIAVITAKSIKNLSSKFISFAILTAIIWSILVAIIYKSNLATFSNSKYVSLLLIGGYLLTIVFTLTACLKSDKLIKNGLIIALGWTLISYFYPWWTNSNFIYLTTHRYLIISSMGMSLLFATIIGLGKNAKAILTIIIISSIFLLLHSISTRNYIKGLYRAHNKETVNKIWSRMPYIPNLGKTNQPLIFYFEGDQTNGDILHDTITFGFPVRMGLMYNIFDFDKLPPTMDSWEEVVSAIKDGKSFIKHYGKTIDPIPIENVYVFKLDGKDNLINLTSFAREKLQQVK